MDVTFTPLAQQVFTMRSARFAAPEKAEAKAINQALDKMDISLEGQQAAADAPNVSSQGWEKLEINLEQMTKDEFMSAVREQLGEQKLEVNWNAAVDPDGQIWCKAYFDSYVSQVTQFRDTAESAIKNHYASAYQEALNNPLGQELPCQLNFIAAKYQCSWSDYFDANMPADERQWTYTQLRSMLTGTNLRLNDPFALKDIHIPTNDELTQIARQDADDKISQLIRQAKGIAD